MRTARERHKELRRIAELAQSGRVQMAINHLVETLDAWGDEITAREKAAEEERTRLDQIEIGDALAAAFRLPDEVKR